MESAPVLRFIRRAPQGIAATGGKAALGVLGGTFNPVTCGHLALADQAQKHFQLDEVLFVLPARLPHREPREASLEDRLAMLELALQPYPRYSLAVSTHGIFLDIARALESHYPRDARLRFLIGADAANRILRWDYLDRKEALREMFHRFELVIARREEELRLPDDPELAPYRSRIHALEMPAECQRISSTQVREICRQGQSLEGLVPADVVTYIRTRNLYRS